MLKLQASDIALELIYRDRKLRPPREDADPIVDAEVDEARNASLGVPSEDDADRWTNTVVSAGSPCPFQP